MVNYQNGKIYKLVCNITGLIYIGSTAEILLSNRLAKHRTDYRKHLNGKYHYITSFKILENDNYEIILLENFPCNNRYELKARERFYIESLNCVNKCIPNRTKKEYYDDNKEQILEQKKKYYNNNKQKILEYQKEYDKQYYEINKDKIIKQKKQYYEKNREHIKEQNKQYREKKKLERSNTI
jgi:hypothetical protein